MSSNAKPRHNPTMLRHGGALLPSDGRENNLALVLQILLEHGAHTRAELSRVTGLTRVTISELVAELLTRGHVVETGQQEGKRPGKPATLVDLNRSGLRIISVDLSSVLPFTAAILDLNGKILRSFAMPESHETATGEQATAQVLELIGQALSHCDLPVLGIGIGTPGIVTDKGEVRSAEKFGWVNYDLRGTIEQATGLNTHVLNDADCAILAEHTFGSGSEHMLLLRLGRGVGCGVITHNTLVRGAQFSAGELGHVKVDPSSTQRCSCGEQGCLEAYACIPAIKRALESGESSDEVGELVGASLASAVAPLISVLDIRNLIFTGPQDVVNTALANWLLAALKERSRTARADDFQLNISQEPEHLVLRGAVVNVLFHELGIS